MRILIINTDYPIFLRGHYAANEKLARSSYAEQMGARNASLFGVFDAYSLGFRTAGHKAWEVHVNNANMQSQWMREHGYEPGTDFAGSTIVPRLRSRIKRRFLSRFRRGQVDSAQTLRSPFKLQGWGLAEMLQAQIRYLRPDVILNHSVSEIGSDLLEPMRRDVQLIVGQIASPLPEVEDYSAYDFMVSSLPNFVNYFRSRGLDAYLSRLGFDQRVLAAAGRLERSIDVSFVGSLSSAHAERVHLIEHLAHATDIAVWGNGVETLDQNSPVHARYRGEAWGIDMFRILGQSKITINTHIGIAENHANNMRLYEATGMGSLLITDRKSDIADIFEPGKEVVCYDSAEECVELIARYRRDDAERERIARAGQRRTLTEHNYTIRTQELAEFFKAAFS